MWHDDSHHNYSTTRHDATTRTTCSTVTETATTTPHGMTIPHSPTVPTTPYVDLLNCNIKTTVVLLDVLGVQKPEVQQGWDKSG